MPQKTVRVGILGVAHQHSEDYAKSVAEKVPNAKLIGVYERNESDGRQFAKRHGVAYQKNLGELLSQVDAVIIASENAFHHSLAVSAAKAGKHVLCEKPIALTLEQAKEMKREAGRSGVKFQMCYTMRYHTVVSVVKELIEDDSIGDILAFVGVNKLNADAISRRWFWDKRLSGGGAAMDHTVHLADVMRWYTGSEVRDVYCEIGKNLRPRSGVEQTFLTTVTFESGVLGHIDGSWVYPAGYPTWGDFSVEVLGSKGVLFLDAFKQNIYFTGANRPDDKLIWRNYGCDANTEMIRSFIDSIVHDKEPLASIDDGIRGLEITLASYESHAKGRVVRLAR